MNKKNQIPATADSDKAEAQGTYHLYCEKCGHEWYSSSWDNYCKRWGCPGRARRM